MKQREKSTVFANRIHRGKKQPKFRHSLIKNARFLPSSHVTYQKYTRKSPPFLDKNRFANAGPFRVYYTAVVTKNNALRATRNSPFCHNRQNTCSLFSALAGFDLHPCLWSLEMLTSSRMRISCFSI